MMRELTAKDFEKAVRNPYFDKFMTKIEVPVSKEDWSVICQLAKINEVRPEMVLQHCISDFVEEIRDDD
jgi:hypothetical protein